MGRYRLRIALLTLGVVLGYGSAFAHFSHWHDWHRYGYGHGHCHDAWSHGAWDDRSPDRGHANPAKPVQ